MLTPQEVAEHAFSKASFGGYNMAQVDKFLDILTEDYTTLYKESAVLKNKMKVLVDKVEEYRATEDAMRMTLLSAQKMATAMVAEAESKRDEAIKRAETEVQTRTLDIRREIDNEQARLAAAQASTAAFVKKLQELYRREQDYLDHLSEITAPVPKADPVEKAVSDIEKSVARLVEEATPAEKDEPDEDPEDTKELDLDPVLSAVSQPAQKKENKFEIIDLTDQPAKQDNTEPPRRIRFEDLQFGKDYEL
ncbi:Cell cycle protein GpsB [bioreactor metagenome]|uniref:Cell cycle protein GpsB n=1 Tax=bioreactor metagenome TaxID=1076179 RepID=A0A644Y3C7_9ZZZZ